MSRAVPGAPGLVSFTRASGRWVRFALRNEPGEGKAARWGKPRPEPGARSPEPAMGSAAGPRPRQRSGSRGHSPGRRRRERPRELFRSPRRGAKRSSTISPSSRDSHREVGLLAAICVFTSQSVLTVVRGLFFFFFF